MDLANVRGRVSFAGIDTADGRAAYKLSLRESDGTEELYFIDMQTWLLAKWRDTSPDVRTPFITECVFRDYRSVGGLVFPYRIEHPPETHLGSWRTVFDSVEINPALIGDEFRLPAAAPLKRD